jgi:hypothetical protein
VQNRRFSAALLALAALTACGKDGDTAAEGELCDVTAAPIYPLDGQQDMLYRAEVEFELSDPDPTATISVADTSGTDVPGTVRLNDTSDVAYFAPSAPLEPSSAYTATLSWCGGEGTIDFSTSDLGSPLTASVEGRTFALDPASGRFVEPEGVGDILSGFLSGAILMGILSEGSDLSFRGALAEDGSTDQDTCYVSVDMPAADFSASPYFELPEQDLEMNIAGYDVKINNLSIWGTFASDGASFGGGGFAGELDLREMGSLLEDQFDDTSAEYLCGLLGSLTVDCQACSTDGEPWCLGVLVDQIVAAETGVELVEVGEVDCHESCALSCENEECPEAANFGVCQ